MSNQSIRKKKGDIYALSIPDNKGYIYIYFIAGNAEDGDLITVFNYNTKELETDMQKILSQSSLYEQNPFIGVIDLDDGVYIKVGNVKPNFIKFVNKPIYIRCSIQCGNIWRKYDSFSENDINGEWREMLKDLKAGVRYYCDDWCLTEVQVTTLRGKVETTYNNFSDEKKLDESHHNVFLCNIIPNPNDYIEKYLTGYDRNSILYNLYL